MIFDRLVIRQNDSRQARMAKSAAWLYWLGVAVVLVGALLPSQQEINHTAVYLLVAGGFLSSLCLVLIPWDRFSVNLFYVMSALACSHIATLIYFSDGVESSYGELYFLIAIWAAYFFSFNGFAAIASMIIASYLAPYLYDSAYDIDHVTSGLIHMLFLLIAGGLVNLLVAQVRQRNIDLSHTNERLALKMREVLREKEKTNAVLASVADGVYVIDNADEIVLWNKSAETITGFDEEEMLGKQCFTAASVTDGDDGQCTSMCGTAASIEEGAGSVGYEVLACRKDGDKIWLSVSAAPIREAGEVVGIVHVFRDISEYKEIDRMKSDFVATVSHELRTPLTSILGFSKTLLRSDANFPDASRESFLLEIVREGERLARLIEDVLSVSRIEAGSLRLDLKPVEAAPAVQHVITNVSRLTSIHNFVINVPDGMRQVQADPDKLHQVLLNLVVNAIKYSPDGGPIIVSVEEADEVIRFSVSDEGVGIAKEHIPHVFERFYRAAKPRGGVAGTGLGLYVSKSLVEEMGGRIWAESTVGEGSRFFFELPLSHAEQDLSEKIAS